MRVLLLGAGASKSYSESPTGQRMPIARDFFSTFWGLPIHEHPWVLFEGVTDYIATVKGVDPIQFLRSGIDIEELHSEIEEHLREGRLSDEELAKPYCRTLGLDPEFEKRFRDFLESDERSARIFFHRAYVQLIFIFAAVVNEIQNGPVSQCHARIARLLRPTDTIITFNWDTLMDRALATETSWRVDCGYEINPRAVFRDAWREADSSCGNDHPKLLKLHGSTNWITSYSTLEDGKLVPIQASDPNTVYVFDYATEPYATFAGRFMGGYADLSYGYYPPNILDDPGKPVSEGHVLISARVRLPWRPEGAADDAGLVSMPLIIPPVKQKTYDMFGELFARLWAEARRALSSAGHIIVIGYSFPRTDHRSNQLFLEAFMSRDAPPRVTIVDPFPLRIRDKFIYEFGVPEQNLTVHEGYFSKEFPIEDMLQG